VSEPRSGKWTIILMAVAFVATSIVAAMLLRMVPTKGMAAGERPIAPGTAPEQTRLPATFPLLLDSNPDGADVYEGEMRIGATPLRLVVDNGAVNEHPRRFRIEHRGYRAFFVTQGPSIDPVRIVAQLVPK
jgi:hypothetical protein